MKYFLRSASLILFVLCGWACSQSLQPVSTVPSNGVPDNFFWSARSLDSAELSYSIDRSGATELHAISSRDGIHVFDQFSKALAFRIVSRGETVAIDSLGAKSLFSLPQGYFFAKDTTVNFLIRIDTFKTTIKKDTTIQGQDSQITIVIDSIVPVHVDSVVQRPGLLTLLERAHLSLGGSWHAGVIAGFGLGKGIEITGRVMDHVDTLLLPVIQQAVPATSYGETYMIRYSHEPATDSVEFPIFWKVYYARNVGPVLIEEYLDSTASKTGKMSLQSQAILKPH
jgi:hypothetical protein